MAITPVEHNARRTPDRTTARTTEPARTLTGAEIVLECLLREGVDTIFGYPGGANLPLYQHLHEYPQIKHVLVRHEQGGAHAADGYARSRRGAVGVVWATSGPGALNLVTGLATAMMDSVPIVAITGQVGTAAVGTDAFQESDVIGSTMSVVKHSYLVTNIEDLAATIKEAFYVARTGRPGPVLIDLPKDIQVGKTSFEYPEEAIHLRAYNPTYRGNPQQVRRVAELIRDARRPVILCGRGVLISGAEDELMQLSHKANIPVGWTLLGTGAFPLRDPLALQMVGFMGAGYTNKAVNGCDLLIMIGMRCDDRVTVKINTFAPDVENIVHIDIDPAEIGKNLKPQVPLVGDARSVLRDLLPMVEPKFEQAWLTQIEAWREEHPVRFFNHTGLLQPQEVLTEMYKRCESEAIVVADVGQNQIWAALWFDYDRPGMFLNSGGSGTMGYAFPAAIGAKFANPGKRVFAVCGEGGFVMNMQELATAVEHNVDIKIVILNNFSLGMVRQFQEDERFGYGGILSQVDLTVTPDLMKLADAFGMKAMRTDQASDVPRLLDEALAHNGPVLLEFRIDPKANVYPIVPLGRGFLDFVEAE
ncbi:MAG: biosynthetic-type acetolactate synthase large subunit [Candidatus Dormibacteria bacterium]